jgi:hypothetical protein
MRFRKLRRPLPRHDPTAGRNFEMKSRERSCGRHEPRTSDAQVEERLQEKSFGYDRPVQQLRVTGARSAASLTA